MITKLVFTMIALAAWPPIIKTCWQENIKGILGTVPCEDPKPAKPFPEAKDLLVISKKLPESCGSYLLKEAKKGKCWASIGRDAPTESQVCSRVNPAELRKHGYNYATSLGTLRYKDDHFRDIVEISWCPNGNRWGDDER